MSLIAGSVKRPVLTSMVTLIVVVVGIASVFRLKSDLLPAIEMPTLSISTEFEGASPDIVERRVTEILEEIVATVPGVERIESESSEGESELSVRFVWGTDIDKAAIDVRGKLEDEISELPESVGRTEVRNFDVASFPVVVVAISSPLDPVELTELIDEQLRPRLSRVEGVAQVDPWGEFEREIRVDVEPERLRALAVSLRAVSDAIEGASIDSASGRIEMHDREIGLRVPTEITHLRDIQETVIEMRNGAPIKVRDVAVVNDTYHRLDRIARIDGRVGMWLAIRKESAANTVDVSRGVLEEIARINRDMPQVHLVATSNQGQFIERSMESVSSSIVYGGLLAVLVLMFFLRSVQSTLIIAIAIPISLTATFALIYLWGLTLNLMTLGGLALGIGMMVDNSIVVLDNIYRRVRELGEDKFDASMRGATEVSAAVVASTLTTLVIFVPIVFVRGVSGELFREFAYVVAFSLFCSLLVALSVVPMLTSVLLRPSADPAGVSRAIELGLERLDDAYRRVLVWALGNRWMVIALSASCFVASIAILPTLDSELIPPSDQGTVEINGEMARGTRLAVVDEKARELERLVLERVPETRVSVVTAGPSSWSPGAGSFASVRLTLEDDRARSNTQIADALRPIVTERMAGMRMRVHAPQGEFLLQRILGDSSGDGLRIDLFGAELDVLDSMARDVVALAEQVEGVVSVDRNRDVVAERLELTTDRDAAADLGVDANEVGRTIEIALVGRNAGTFRVGGNSYPILVRLADAEHRSIDEVLNLEIPNRRGGFVPLSMVARTREVDTPLVIYRRGQRRVVSVTPNIGDRPAGSVAWDLERRLASLALPTGYEIQIAGTYEAQREAQSELGWSFFLALALVYMVLAAQYESFRDPLIVMLTVPMASTGVFVALGLTDTTLNIQSYIGCIMLGGIVVNNAVLIVDQITQLRAEGVSVYDALVEAGRRRLRPILMTTLTTALALVPLALGYGEGAEAQASLARAVLGGLSASTAFTLVLIPAVYALVHANESVRTPESEPNPG